MVHVYPIVIKWGGENIKHEMAVPNTAPRPLISLKRTKA